MSVEKEEFKPGGARAGPEEPCWVLLVDDDYVLRTYVPQVELISWAVCAIDVHSTSEIR